jgi:hypothetical protein
MGYSDELSAQANLRRSPDNNLLEGYVVPGSWDPAEGTIEVLIGDTAAIFTDYGDAPTTVVANLMTPGLGAQYGPVGGERVEMFRTPSGYSALLEHGPDDTPGIPGGEWGIAHRNADGVYDSFVKLTNDGSTAGDGLGGALLGGLGAFTQIGTSDATLQSAYDATAGTLVHQAGDIAKVVHDKTLGQIGMGAAPGDLPDTAKLINNAHLTTTITNARDEMLQSLATQMSAALITASIGAGSPAAQAAAFALIVQAAGWVTSNVSLPTIADGSPVAKVTTS